MVYTSSSATCFLGSILYFYYSCIWTQIALILPFLTEEYSITIVYDTILEYSIYTIVVVPNLFGTRDRFHGRQFFHGWRGAGRKGVMVQGVMQAMGSGRWSVPRSSAAHLLLCGPVPNRPCPGVGDPCTIIFNYSNSEYITNYIPRLLLLATQAITNMLSAMCCDILVHLPAPGATGTIAGWEGRCNSDLARLPKCLTNWCSHLQWLTSSPGFTSLKHWSLWT